MAITGSTAERRIRCALSGALEDEILPVDAPQNYTSKGIEAHTILEHLLDLEGPMNPADLDEQIDRIRDSFDWGLNEEGFIVPTPELEDVERDKIHECYNAFHRLLASFSPAAEYFLEEEVQIPGHVRASRLDALIIDPQLGHVAVIDFKTGYKGVKAFENAQLAYYALGAFHSLLNAQDYDDYVWSLHVIQAGKEDALDSWSVPKGWLKQYEEVLTVASENEGDPSAEPTPGGWCQFCRGKIRCEAYLGPVEDALVLIGKNRPTKGYTTVEMSRAMTILPRLKKWISEVEKTAGDWNKRDVKIPNFKIVRGRAGNRKIPEQYHANVIKALQDLRLDPYAPMKLDSPAQLEKQAKEKAIDISNVLNQYVVRAPGKPVYAEDSDSRPSIGMSAIRERRKALMAKKDKSND